MESSVLESSVSESSLSESSVSESSLSESSVSESSVSVLVFQDPVCVRIQSLVCKILVSGLRVSSVSLSTVLDVRVQYVRI